MYTLTPMRIKLAFFAFVGALPLCLAADEPLAQADESNKPGLVLVRHERPFRPVAELFASPGSEPWTVSNSANASVSAGFETRRVGRATERLLAVRAAARDRSDNGNRRFSASLQIAPVPVGPATHVLVECGSERFVNGAWGPLAVEAFAGGAWRSVAIHPEFENRGGVICSYLLPLEAERGDVFNSIRVVANAPDDENVLLVRRIALVCARSASERTLSVETLTEPSRIRTYPHGTDVSFRVRGVRGEPKADDRLEWKVVDCWGEAKKRGVVPFPASAWTSGVTVTVPGRDLGAGFFAFRFALASDGATTTVSGTRPGGFETFGLLPEMAIPSLAHADDSRFGAQGTIRAYEERGLSPVYDMLGFRWVYSNARPVHARPTRESTYEPMSAEEVRRNAASDPDAQHGYVPLVNMHGIPAWMAAKPADVADGELARDPTRIGQKYPLADPAEYEDLVGRLMTTESRRRMLTRPHLARDWYELHWEPDWHWSGTDEEFIAYYSAARRAMDRADPGAVLTAANYGVIDKGNALLRRLFDKGLGKYVNGLTTHLYLLRPDWPEGAGLAGEVRELRRLADKYIGADAPIINTEGGTELKGNPARLDDLREHSARLVRGHLIALGEGCTTTFFFYVGDYGKYTRAMIHYGLFFNQDTQGRPFGPDSIAPKPAGMAVAALIRILEGSRTVGRIQDMADGVYAYEFSRGGTRIIAVWSPDGEREVSFASQVPDATIYDFMGNPHPAERRAGKITLAVGSEPRDLVIGKTEN